MKRNVLKYVSILIYEAVLNFCVVSRKDCVRNTNVISCVVSKLNMLVLCLVIVCCRAVSTDAKKRVIKVAALLAGEPVFKNYTANADLTFCTRLLLAERVLLLATNLARGFALAATKYTIIATQDRVLHALYFANVGVTESTRAEQRFRATKPISAAAYRAVKKCAANVTSVFNHAMQAFALRPAINPAWNYEKHAVIRATNLVTNRLVPKHPANKPSK